MKKFLGMMGLILALLISTAGTSTAQTTTYNTVDVYNTASVNVVDFVFSYDDYNNCMNNFLVINNTNTNLKFNFEVKMDNAWMYTGVVILAPYGRVYFNDAFQNCNSSSQVALIRTW